MKTFVATMNAFSFGKLAKPQTEKRDAPELYLDRYLQEFLFELGTLVLRDKDDAVLPLTIPHLLRRNSPCDNTYFYYGKVHSIDDTKKNHVTVTSVSVFGEKLYLTIDKHLWGKTTEQIREHPLIKGTDIWISGLFDVKMMTSYHKGTYDSKTRSVHKAADTSYRANILRHGVIFFANSYGLICTTPTEKETGEWAMAAGYGLKRAFVPLPEESADIQTSVCWCLPTLIVTTPQKQMMVL